MRNKFSLIIIAALTLITFNLWLMSKNDLGLIKLQPLRSLSQIIALIGIVYMSLTLLLTTRFKPIEKFLGGLDSVYYIHQILGSIAFIFIMNHPLLLAFQSLPNINTTTIYLIPGLDLGYNLGIFALYTMILSFIFMIFIKIPYHLWKITHKFLGLAFLLASVHSLIIASDVSSYLPLRIWIGFFIAIGLASSIYIIFLYKYLGPKFLYEITKIERVLDIVDIYLKPVTGRSLKFAPGQFIYAEFANQNIGTETHPFSLSSSPQNKLLRLSAKMLGDYTVKLPDLRPGDRAFIYGPYGAFGLAAPENPRVIWIAGGIGVTPFLSKLEAELYQKHYQSIDFYYSYKTPVEGVYDSEIKTLAQKIPYCHYFSWCTQEKKRLTAQAIAKKIPIGSTDAVLCCGPSTMMNELKKQFVNLGLAEKKFMFENFSFLP